MITAMDVAEAKIRALRLSDALLRIEAEEMEVAWRKASSNIPGELLRTRARLTDRYQTAFLAWREADVVAGRLEAQRVDEQAGIDRKLVLDASSFWGRRGSEAP